MYMEDVGDLACVKCKSTHEDDHMAICDKCGDANHLSCIGIKEVPQGPFYCPRCIDIIKESIDKDIIYND